MSLKADINRYKMDCEQCKWRNPETCKECKKQVKVTMFKGYNKVSIKN